MNTLTIMLYIPANTCTHILMSGVNIFCVVYSCAVIQKRRTKLTYIKFNPTYPILLVGDDRGGVVCLKLSPNLRRALKVKNHNCQAKRALTGDLSKTSQGGGGVERALTGEVEQALTGGLDRRLCIAIHVISMWLSMHLTFTHGYKI